MNALKPVHGAPKPRDVPADMQDASPQPFPFAIGDFVTYTNGNGLKGRARIRGFAKEPHGGRFVYLEHWSQHGWRLGAWWFAVEPESISDARESAA